MSWPKYLINPILNIWGEREEGGKEGGREGGKKEKKTTEKKREETDKTVGWDRKGREEPITETLYSWKASSMALLISSDTEKAVFVC